MKTYQVDAKRWTHGWELEIDGVGVTQSHGLADAEMMVRDFIALDLDVPPDSFEVTITAHVDAELDNEVREAREQVRAAAQAQIRAAEASRRAARALSAKGLSGRDIAAVLEVSPQRVSQLITQKVIGAAAAGKSTALVSGASRGKSGARTTGGVKRSRTADPGANAKR